GYRPRRVRPLPRAAAWRAWQRRYGTRAPGTWPRVRVRAGRRSFSGLPPGRGSPVEPMLAGVRTIDWVDGAVEIVDQTALPGTTRILRLSTVDELVSAVRRLAVRGAPAIGVAGALGVALAARRPRPPALVGGGGPRGGPGGRQGRRRGGRRRRGLQRGRPGEGGPRAPTGGRRRHPAPPRAPRPARHPAHAGRRGRHPRRQL